MNMKIKVPPVNAEKIIMLIDDAKTNIGFIAEDDEDCLVVFIKSDDREDVVKALEYALEKFSKKDVFA